MTIHHMQGRDYELLGRKKSYDFGRVRSHKHLTDPLLAGIAIEMLIAGVINHL